MRAAHRVLVGAGAVASFSLLGAPAALAQQACDDYSGGCVDVGGAVVSDSAVPAKATRGSVTPSTLPFTGGEVVLLAAAGAGAVAVGAAAVAMGRRRVTASV